MSVSAADLQRNTNLLEVNNKIYYDNSFYEISFYLAGYFTGKYHRYLVHLKISTELIQLSELQLFALTLNVHPLKLLCVPTIP